MLLRVTFFGRLFAVIGLLILASGPISRSWGRDEPPKSCAQRLKPTNPVSAEGRREYFLSGGTDFSFTLARGRTELNHFLREGENLSHTVINSGTRAHIITVFPAGNSAAALFPAGDAGLELKMAQSPRALRLTNSAGEHGVRFTVQANRGEMELKQVIAGSTRDVRDYEHDGITYADAAVQATQITPQRLILSRKRLDGLGRYLLQLTVPKPGSIAMGAGGRILVKGSGDRLLLTVDAVTSETPYAPWQSTAFSGPRSPPV